MQYFQILKQVTFYSKQKQHVLKAKKRLIKANHQFNYPLLKSEGYTILFLKLNLKNLKTSYYLIFNGEKKL